MIDVNLSPPDVEELVVTWLAPLGPTDTRRAAGAPLPFRLVKRLTGGDDMITDYTVVSVHTFATDYDQAVLEARKTHVRMLALRPWVRVRTAAGVVWADHVRTREGPHWEFYSATLNRFVATYHIDMRFREFTS